MSNKVLGILIALFSVIIITLVGAILVIISDDSQPIVSRESNGEEVIKHDSNETTKENVGGITEESTTDSWDEMKSHDKIVGKSDKDFASVFDDKPGMVRNDTTGNWRKTSIAGSVDIEEYALSYFDTYMNEEEVHFIINFSNDTTTWLNGSKDGILNVEIREHIKREEHDANILGSGMTLKSYIIYPDGDIQEIE